VKSAGPIFFAPRALALLAGLCLLVGCGKKSPPAPATASAPAEGKNIFRNYAGSASCRACHEEAFALWEKSNHALAERPVNTTADGAAFEPARTVLAGADRAMVRFTNGQFQVASLGLQTTQETFVVQRVIGRDPLRQFLVPFPNGRLQVLAASYDPRSNEWFNSFGDENRQPGEWGSWTGRGMNWNAMCAECHNTRLQKNYAPATDTYQTTMAEMSVGCEACHGPLRAHNDWQAKFGQSHQPDPTVPKMSRDVVLNTCAFCHARRSNLTGDFPPGDRFDDHCSLEIVDDSDRFYPDGQIRDEDYEYTAFLGSRMHDHGVMCLDCHNPHSMKTLLPGNWLCLRCHGAGATNAPAIDPVCHAHHLVHGFATNGPMQNVDLAAYNSRTVKETGGECVNCHMPQTPYMQRHWRHDHGFTSPDPLLTKKFGIPNACNRCHADQSADWALTWTEQWYGEKMARPARARTDVLARARAGDAAARDELLTRLPAESSPYWRAVEAGLLSAWIEQPAVSKVLLATLTDTNSLVRASTVRALSPLADGADTNIAAALKNCLADSSRNVRLAAAHALQATLDPSSPVAQEWQRYLAINADQPTGQLQLGLMALAHNDLATALAHLQKAVAWDPFSPPLRQELAVVLSALNRPQEALQQLQEAGRQQPRSAEIHYQLGLAFHESGELEKTVAELQTAVELDPRHAAAWYNLGLAHSEQGHADDALAALTRAESLSPTAPNIPYARATVLARLGRATEARQAAQRALEIQPDFSAARQLLEMLPP